MNTENILTVADAIEQHTIPNLGFNMGHFFSSDLPDMSGHNCDTTACIGGWANAIRGYSGVRLIMQGSRSAAAWLGLDDDKRMELFYASNYPVERMMGEGDWFTSITPEQAVRTLRHLAATGQVDWTV